MHKKTITDFENKMKTCSRDFCDLAGQMQPFTNFGGLKKSPLGLASQCKRCAVKLATEHAKNNKEKIAAYKKQYSADNKEHINEYQRIKKIEDEGFRILHNLRTRVGIAIKQQLGKKAHKTIDLLGCSIEFLTK